MTLNRTLGVMLASTAFISFANAAFALDGNDVLAKINAAYANQGGTISVTEAAVDGENVILKGAALSVAGTNGTKFPLGDVTLEGVEEGDDGYSIEKVSFADVNFAQDGAEIKASDINLTGVWVPYEAKLDSIYSLLLYEGFHVGPITVSNAGKQVVSVAEVNGTITVAEDESKLDFDADITGIKADLTAAPDPKSQEAIKALGVEQIAGEVTMKGGWTLANGKLEVNEYAFDFENVGRLDINFGLTGYTLAFIKSMQDAVKAAETNPDKAAGQQALGMSMLGLMAQLSYNGASIRFDDAGITSKVLDYAGKQQGVDGKQFAQSIKGMLPMMLGELKMPELQQQIVDAANAYLDEPKSITVSAEPAQPLPFPQIMGAGMGGNPADLVKTLNVKITAND